MAANVGGLRDNPLEEIFRTRTGLLLLILVLLATGCLVTAGNMAAGTFRDILNAVGTGALVAAVVGCGQTLVTASAARRALVEPIVEESRNALSELSAEYRSLNSEFFPTHIFEASSEPDPDFNQLLMTDLRGSKQYFFRGFTARHAAARLLLEPAERETHVIIADPRDGATMSGRARHLLRHEGAEADVGAVRDQLANETRMGLIGLFLARAHCTRIDITVVTDPPPDRLELFDDSVWVTLYSSERDASRMFPRTLRFAESSYIYNMQRAEILRICDSRTERHYEITPETTEASFGVLFREVTDTELTGQRFSRLQQRFHAFRQEFTHTAEIGNQP